MKKSIYFKQQIVSNIISFANAVNLFLNFLNIIEKQLENKNLLIYILKIS